MESEMIASNTKYSQLRRYLADMVEEGELSPGDRLPSIQSLMATYKVSQATAVRAIEMLAQEGVLERRPRVGVFVAHRKGQCAPAVSVLADWATEILHQGLPPPESLLLEVRRMTKEEAAIGMSALALDTDVMFTTSLSFTDRAVRGDFLPLDEFLARDQVFADSFDPAATRIFRHGGRTFALPVYAAPFMAHVNLDALAKAGVPPPSADWTWDCFEDVLRRLREAGFERPWVWPRLLAFWLPFLFAEGEEPWHPATQPISIFTPSTVKAFARLKRLAREFGPPCLMTDEMPWRAFEGEESPVLFWGTTNILTKIRFRHAVMPLPGSHGRPTVVQSEGLAITARCHDPESAWQAIRYFTGPEASSVLEGREIMFPPRKDAILRMLARTDKGYHRAYAALCNANLDYLALGQERAAVLHHALEGWWAPDDDLEARLRAAQNVMDTVLGALSAQHDLRHA